MIHKYNSLILIAALLGGCVSNPIIPSTLSKSCDPLPQLTDGTVGGILDWRTDAGVVHDICANRHKNLVESME